jgi:hypothetical protein
LLSFEGVVTIFLADMPAVASCAAIKYAALAHPVPGDESMQRRHEAYGRLYLQKIVQLQFDLPAPSQYKIWALVKKLTAEEDGLPPPTQPSERPALPAVQSEEQKPPAPSSDAPQGDETLPESAAGETPQPEAKRPVPPVVAEPSALKRFFSWNPNLPQEAVDRMQDRFLGTVVFVLIAALFAYRVSLFQGVSIFVITILSLKAMFEAANGIRRRALAREREKVRVVVEEQFKKAGPTDFEAVQKAVSDLPGNVSASTVREQYEIARGTKSTEFQDARRTALLHLPPNPRQAKRMINQLRLLTYIATDRGLLDSGQPLKPEHLGKWVVFRERWPELAQKVLCCPSIAGEMEQSAKEGPEAFSAKLTSLGAPEDAAGPLMKLFGKEPLMGPTMERLISLDPEAEMMPQEEMLAREAVAIADALVTAPDPKTVPSA